MDYSNDSFMLAPGIKGLVMLVFTLPSFPEVSKIIKDKFGPNKDFTRDYVRQKYLLVKKHDRVGRMADTLEYSNVAIPLARINAELLSELRTLAASQIEEQGEWLIIKHMYIELRLKPPNLSVMILNTYGKDGRVNTNITKPLMPGASVKASLE